MSEQLVTKRRESEKAGRAWGARALDWAYLVEPYARTANEVLFDRLSVGHDVQLLDIACGSGFAAQLASRLGAAVSGIDASEELVTIAGKDAGRRLPCGRHVCAPFSDASFDVVTSFNGIWKGCEAALDESRRVSAPGGRLGLTYWGSFEHLGLMPYFLKVIQLSPASHAEATYEQGDTGRAGIIEEMLASTGFVPTEPGRST